MDMFNQALDTNKRTFTLTDKSTGATLVFRQDQSQEYLDAADFDDTDRLVEFVNDLVEDLTKGVIHLRFWGENLLTWDDDKFPCLQGSIQLENCTIDNPRLHNAVLKNVKIPNAGNTNISYSNIFGLEHNFAGDIYICYCIVNDSYSQVRDGLLLGKNEFLMGKAVDGTMW